MMASKRYASMDAETIPKSWTFERKEVGDDDVLVDIAFCGVCHTDIHLTRNEWGPGIFPMFMEPWQGALSVLYAAVSEHASGGNMYEPEENGLRSYPTLANIQENALIKKWQRNFGRLRKK